VAEKIPSNPELSQKILKETKVLEWRLARVDQRNTKVSTTIPNYTKKESVGILGTTLGYSGCHEC